MWLLVISYISVTDNGSYWLYLFPTPSLQWHLQESARKSNYLGFSHFPIYMYKPTCNLFQKLDGKFAGFQIATEAAKEQCLFEARELLTSLYLKSECLWWHLDPNLNYKEYLASGRKRKIWPKILLQMKDCVLTIFIIK